MIDPTIFLGVALGVLAANAITALAHHAYGARIIMLVICIAVLVW